MNKQDRINYIREEIRKTISLNISQEQGEKLDQYYQMLTEKNKVMNLTRVTEFEEVVIKHFADSLSSVVCPDVDFNGKRILDLGCGAGFPGIPLKIVWPDTEIVLLDSVGKKVAFVNEVIDELELSDARAIHGRAEDLAQDPEYREIFDICTSRAVANMSTLAEYCIPFVKTGGLFVAYKTLESIDEVQQAGKAVKLLGGKELRIFEVPLNGMQRLIAFSEKEKPTPLKYPRKAGMPSRNPLK